MALRRDQCALARTGGGPGASAVLAAGQGKDYRALAAYPAPLHSDLVLCVWRVDGPGVPLSLDIIVGPEAGTTSRWAYCLAHQGHLRLLLPPAGHDPRAWAHRCRLAGSPVALHGTQDGGG